MKSVIHRKTAIPVRAANFDLTLAKDTALPVRENTLLQFRAEFYNLFNHANREFAGGADLNAPVFAANTVAGPIARYGGTPRQVVVAARVVF